MDFRLLEKWQPQLLALLRIITPFSSWNMELPSSSISRCPRPVRPIRYHRCCSRQRSSRSSGVRSSPSDCSRASRLSHGRGDRDRLLHVPLPAELLAAREPGGRGNPFLLRLSLHLVGRTRLVEHRRVPQQGPKASVISARSNAPFTAVSSKVIAASPSGFG
jgi:hypothetical protein